jgi:GTP pyrophosphokinase
VFSDQVFVYTPKGEIKDLRAGATPLDFAYQIHTDVGHQCIGAKVNGRLVPLNYELQNGDVV